jgi:outer membrane biosynthesis protein TonB
MEEARFSGDLALFEQLGGDALAQLHLARHKSGPVVMAQTYNPDAPLAAQLAALVTAADRLKAPKVPSLLAVSHTQTSPGPMLAHALFPGQLLSGVLEKARAEGMPLAADLALLIADKVADALTHLPAGSRHPLITIFSVLLSYDGDVTVIDVPLAAALAGQPLSAEWIGAERAARLHKTTMAGKPSPRAEVWQLGAMILEMVGGEPFSTGGDIASRVTELCKAQEISADIRDVIERALVENSEAFRSIEEMKEVVGKLIYQGAYAPSTFNLAFFMHTLYRGEDESFETRVKSLASARLEFPASAPPPATPRAAPAPTPAPAPPHAPAAPAPPRPAERGPAFTGFAESESPPPEPPGGKKSPIGLIAGIAAAVLLLAGGGWFMTRGKSGADAKKLQDMEMKQKALEAENQRLAKETEEFHKQQADLKAKEEAQQKLISGSKNAEEKKQAEAELAKLQAKKQALEDERKLQEAEAAKQAALVKPAPPPVSPPVKPAAPAGGSSAAGAVTAPPPSAPAADPGPPPAPPPADPVKEIYSSAEVDQTAAMKKEVKAEYPRNGRGNAVVILRLIVDDVGKVVSAEVAKSDVGGPGFEEAAKGAALKSVFSPAVKDGRPVKSYVTKTYKFGAT